MQNNIKKLSKKIIEVLPYEKSFNFVDELSFISDDKIIGHYTFTKNECFYKAHFKHIPITPGIILIEMMGQVGMVCHLIYLNNLHLNKRIFHPILSNVEASFLKEIKVEDKLTIISDKIYYRKGILKSNLKLLNSNNEICSLCTAQLHLVFE
jgi:3-hydroxyacyl-[acyl-carrier-protein] dehydratase